MDLKIFFHFYINLLISSGLRKNIWSRASKENAERPEAGAAAGSAPDGLPAGSRAAVALKKRGPCKKCFSANAGIDLGIVPWFKIFRRWL
jgi:hypothetical protein